MFYAGIFLISLSTLLFEVSLLRVFSIALWYHFAFMAVSIAMLGYGGSGTILMLAKKRHTAGILCLSPSIFGILAPLSYVITNKIPFDPARFVWDASQIYYILAYYLFLSLPFVFSGLTIALAFIHLKERAGHVYMSDLMGAGMGPLLAVYLFPLSGGEGVIFISSIGGFLSSIFLSASIYGRRDFIKRAVFPLASTFSVIVILVLRPSFMEIRISEYKALPFSLSHKGSKLLETGWNSFSRVDVIESPAVRFAPGLSLKYLEDLPAEQGITVDADGLIAIVNPSKPERLRFFDYLPTALPYKLLEGRGVDVFIIDSGGGFSIIEAVYHGAATIEGSEKNPLVARFSNTQFSGFVYDRGDFRFGEGRLALKTLDKNYDLIQMGVTNLSTSGTGIYGISEDYRFTIEAFTEYHKHLKAGGFLSITRYLLPPPREELKLLNAIVKSLERLGVENPEEHLFVFRTLETFTVVVKNGKLTDEDLRIAKDFLNAMSYDVIWHKGIKPTEVNLHNRFPEPVYYRLVSALLDKERRAETIREYPFKINPPTDDKPFFHDFLKIGRVFDVIKSVGGKWQILIEGGGILPLVFLQSLLLSFIFLILPLLRGIEKKSLFSPFPLLLYFFLIGLGFMLVEIPLIQRFILFVGHPEYAFSAVISSLLISSSIGSFWSQRFIPKKGILKLIPILSSLIIISAVSLPYAIDNLHGGLALRIFYTFILIFPIGIVMGAPFPLGVRLIEVENKTCIPWAWAMNGFASVIGGSGAIMLAIGVGFKGALAVGGGMYLLAWLCVKRNPGRTSDQGFK